MKVFVALPAFGMQCSAHTTASLVAVTHVLAERGWFGGFGPMSFPDLEDLRAIFLTLWYDKLDASHILFVDADMQFEPQLVLDMIAFDKPLVGALYPKRTLPIQWVGSAFPGDDRPQTDCGFMKMEGIGFGVALIRRDCIDNMIEAEQVEIDQSLTRYAAGRSMIDHGLSRMIRAFDKINMPDRRLSEDLSFCHRHRMAGGDVWAATHHTVTHVGDYGFKGRYADVLAKTKEVR